MVMPAAKTLSAAELRIRMRLPPKAEASGAERPML
jgi:hypothetical protein